MTQWHGTVRQTVPGERHCHLVPLTETPTYYHSALSRHRNRLESKMTLTSLLSHGGSVPSNYELPPVPDVDRTHWSKGEGSWKGGKGNPTAALSALTLLAFLFFLNILQSCLRDTIGQNNGMFMMVLPPNATATTRVRREITESQGRDTDEGSTTDQPHQTWTDLDISNLVHTQVESYWSNEARSKARKNLLIDLKLKTNLIENNLNATESKSITKTRISTKLIVKKKEENSLLNSTSRKSASPSENKSTELKSTPTHLIQQKNRFWFDKIKLVVNNFLPYVKKTFCCSKFDCKRESNTGSLISKTMEWFCSSVKHVDCGDSSKCSKMLKL